MACEKYSFYLTLIQSTQDSTCVIIQAACTLLARIIMQKHTFVTGPIAHLPLPIITSISPQQPRHLQAASIADQGRYHMLSLSGAPAWMKEISSTPRKAIGWVKGADAAPPECDRAAEGEGRVGMSSGWVSRGGPGLEWGTWRIEVGRKGQGGAW